MTGWTVTVKYANYAKRRDFADHLTPDTSGISADSGGGSRNEYTTFISGLDIDRVVRGFQAQTQVRFDFLIDARVDLDGLCFSC